jgi:hypothetical protein
MRRDAMAVDSAPGMDRSAAPGGFADLIRNGVALFSAGAAGLHFAVAQSHFEEYWLFGAFFVSLAWFQALWAILVVASPHRILYLLGALANGATVALWAVTRTTGIPVGPTPGEPEVAEFIDVLSTAFEVLVVVGCVLLLARGTAGRFLGGRRVLAGTVAVGLIVVSLTSGAVALWNPHHAEEPAGEHQEEQPAGAHQEEPAEEHS